MPGTEPTLYLYYLIRSSQQSHEVVLLSSHAIKKKIINSGNKAITQSTVLFVELPVTPAIL